MAEETPPQAAPPARKPQMRTEAAQAASANFTPIPMEVSANKKKQLRGKTTMPHTALTVDRSGTFATDGREDLPTDFSLVKSLLRFWTAASTGAVWPKIADIKVTIAGTDDEPLLVVLNGRQRYKAIKYLNELLATIHDMWKKCGQDEVRLKNTLIALSESARNIPPNTPQEQIDKLSQWAWMDAEDIEFLCGGKVNNEKVPGLLFKNTKNKDEGPMPYWAHVDYTDINPNSPEALELSLAERITVPTPIVLKAKQMQRLLDAGRTPETVAAVMGRDVKTIGNWKLILLAEPEVQAALDAETLSFVTFKKMFFLSTAKHGTLIRPKAEQLQILSDLLANDAGKGKAGSDYRAGLAAALDPNGQPVPPAAPAAPASPEANGAAPASPAPVPAAPSADGTQPDTPAPQNSTPMPPPPAAPAPTPKKKANVGGSIVLDALPRTVIIIRERMKLLPEPRIEQGADVYIPTLKLQAQAQAAAATLAYLGGDGNAFDDLPDLKPMVTEAIAMARLEEEAKAKAPPAEGPMDPKANLARDLFAIFSEWDEDADDTSSWPREPEDGAENRCGWPSELADLLAAREGMKLLQAAYDTKAKETGSTPEKKDFAQEWILSELLGQTT